MTNPWLQSQPWIDREGANIDKYMERLDTPLDFDLHSKLVEWRKKGFVIFEGVVSNELIDALNYDIEHLIKHYKDFQVFAELRGSIKPIQEFRSEELELDGVKINSIHSVSLAAAKLSLTKEIPIFLSHIFESPACVLQSLTFKKGSQQSIHIDYPYVRCQTQLAHLAASWIALEDIHPEAGPLAYYAGSHHTEVSGFFDWGNGSILYEPSSVQQPHHFSAYLKSQMQQANCTPHVFCPKKGDVLLWHGNLSHEGTEILRDDLTRKSYVTHYTSLLGYPDIHKLPSARNGKGLLLENGGYCFDYPWISNPNKLPSWVRHL
ncbi:MAG: phytanoyl-CoA dioxygenase family protein [Spongiibacteraceae bacterium]